MTAGPIARCGASACIAPVVRYTYRNPGGGTTRPYGWCASHDPFDCVIAWCDRPAEWLELIDDG